MDLPTGERIRGDNGPKSSSRWVETHRCYVEKSACADSLEGIRAGGETGAAPAPRVETRGWNFKKSAFADSRICVFATGENPGRR